MASPPRIPLVDFAHYRKGTAKERATFVQAFGGGLKEFGFVAVENHGVNEALVRDVYSAAERFFELSGPSKARYQVPGGGGQRGYTGLGEEHAKNQTVGDLKEFFHVGRDLPAGHTRRATYGENVWPTEVAGLQSLSLELFDALDVAAATMLQAIAEFFEVGRDTFSDMARDGNSILRIIHYPPLAEAFLPGAVRAAQHEDINLITLLCEGTASGLEILTRTGQWIPVDTLKGQIVVDSGDMLSRVTNDVMPATTHRVVNPDGPDLARYSMPFFVHPHPDCVLKPLPSTETADNPAKYPPITADEFLRERLREIGLIQ